MRHIIKYLLVIAVLVAGYHAASHFKTAAPQASSDDAQTPDTALSQHPDSQPHTSTPPTQAPLAALIDTEEQTAPTADFDWPTVRTEQNGERRPSITDSETTNEAGQSGKPTTAQRAADRKGPGRKKSSSRDKRNTPKNSTTRKQPWQGKSPAGTDNRRSDVWGANTDDGGASTGHRRPKTKASSSPKSPVGGATSTTDTRRADVASGVTPKSTSANKSSSFPATRPNDDWPSGNWSPGHRGSNKSASSSAKETLEPKKNDTPTKAKNKLRRHRIVDNDTLPKLAQTYFGDRSRYLDIFHANPEVLSDPRLLPIGVEITIPVKQTRNAMGQDSGGEVKHAPDDQTKEGDMVPVPSYALPPRQDDYQSPVHTGHLPRSRFGA